MAQIPGPLDFTYRRPRFLEPAVVNNPTPQDSVTLERIRQEQLDSNYASYKRVSDKANIIMDYASKVAKKYTIPVPIEAVEVRQAVSRQDPDSNNGQYISFATFVAMLDLVEGMASKVDYRIIDNQVIADPAANERSIRKRLDSKFGDDDGLLALLLVGGQLMTLYMIHLINGMWRGPEHLSAAPKTAGPVPTEVASPTAEAIRQAVVGFAASTLITGVNQTLAQMFLDDGQPNSSSKAIIQGAIGTAKQIDLPPIVGKIKTIMGMDDYKTILKYCVKYISETKDRGYEFWFAYMTARRTRYLSSVSLRSAPMFSEKEHARIRYSVDGAQVDPDSIVLENRQLFNSYGADSFLENVAAELQDGLNRSIVRPTDQFLCAQDYESSGFERGLNFMAQVLDTKLSRDVICCLVRFLGNMGVESLDTLKKIRAVLGIFLNSNTLILSATLQNFMAFFVNWVRDTVLKLVMELVQVVLDKIYRIVQEFLYDIEADLGVLSDCPLIIELIQGLLEALDTIMKDIQELVRNYVLQVELNLSVQFGLDDLPNQVEGHRGGLIKVHKKRSLRRLIAIIDGIISVIESGATICDIEERDNLLNDPTTSRRVVTYDDILDSPGIVDLEDRLDIPSDVKAEYFSDAYEVKLQDGSRLPDYQIGEVQMASYNDISADDECRRALPEELISQALQRNKERTQ